MNNMVRDVKTKHEVTTVRDVKAIFLRTAFLLLLLLGGGMASEAWADTYAYVLLGAPDGSGHRPQVAKTENTTANAELPTHMTCPFVSAYHYYSSATANSDGTFTVAGTSDLTAGDAHGKADGETIYVTYDVNTSDATVGTLVNPFSNMNAHYKIKFRNSSSYYLSVNGNDVKIHTSYMGSELLADEWILEGDPYTLKLHPVSSVFNGNNYTVGVSSISSDNSWYLNQTFDTFIVITQGDGIITLRFNPGGNVMANENVVIADKRSDSENMNLYRGTYQAGIGLNNSNRIDFEKVTTATTTYFHIIDDGGNILTSASMSTTAGTSLSTIAGADGASLPDALKRYGVTLKTDHFYTNRLKTAEATTASADNPDIYLAYELNSQCPVTFSTDFDHATWYNMKFYNQPDNDDNGVQLIQYFTQSGFVGELWTNVKSASDPRIADNTDSRAYFAFMGNPYSFKIVNLYGGPSLSAKLDGDLGAYGKYIKMRSDGDQWTWMAPTNGGTFKILAPSTYADATPTFWNPFNTSYENNARISTWTTSYNNARDLTLLLAPRRYVLTYIVVDGSGNELARTSESVLESSTPAALAMPDVLKRAFIDDVTNETGRGYHLWNDAACTETATTWTPTADKTVYITYTLNDAGVDAFTTSLASPKWQYIKSSTSNANYLTSTSVGALGSATLSASATDVSVFAFALVGNPYDVRIVSRNADATGATDLRPAANAHNSALSIAATDAALSHWETVPPSTSDGTFYLALKGSYTKSGGTVNGAIFQKTTLRQLKIGGIDNTCYFNVEPWAERASVKYIVIDNSGQHAVWYTTITDQLDRIPNEIASPLADNYRFYATETAALADDGGTTYDASATIHSFGEATETTGDTHVVYVRYSLSSEQVLLGNGGMSYMSGIADTDPKARYAILSPSSYRGWVLKKAADDEWNFYPKSALWYFEGTDPYHLTLKNCYDRSKYFYVSPESGKQKLIVTDVEANSAHLALLYNNYSTLTGMSLLLVPSSEAGQFKFLETAPTDYAYFWQTDASDNDGRLKDSDRTSSEAKFSLKLTTGITYFIKNLSGDIAIYGTRTDQTAGDTPDLPSDIKSPLATNFRYFTDLACTNEITNGTLPSSHCSVYVTYQLTLNPEIDLNGDTKYNIKFDSNNGYIYDKRDLVPYGNPLYYNTATTDAELKTNPYLWYFTSNGGDPYDIRVNSMNASGEYWGGKYEDSQHYLGTKFSNTMDKLVLVKNAAHDTWELLWAGKLRDGYNQYVSISSIANRIDLLGDATNVSGHDNVRLRIEEPFAITVTYHLVTSDNYGLKATVKQNSNQTPQLPDILRSVQTNILGYYKTSSITDANKYADGEEIGSTTDIYVNYEYQEEADLPVGDGRLYNIKINGRYLYKQQDSQGSLSTETTNANLNQNTRQWKLKFHKHTGKNDPYNINLTCSNTTDNNTYFKLGQFKSGNDELDLNPSNDEKIFDFFVADGATPGKYELRLRGGDLNYGEEASPTLYYILGLSSDGTTPKLIKNSEAEVGDDRLQVTFIPITFNYHLINLSGYEVLTHTVNGIPSTYSLPDELRSPLATNYRYYQHSQFNITKVNGKWHYELKAGESPIAAPYTAQEEVGDIYVLYDFDATAGIDLSGETAYGMFINGGDAKGYRMLGIRTNDNNNGVGVYTQPFQGERCYSWYVKGSTNNDPYNVSFQNLWSSKYQYPNGSKVVVGGNTATTPFMVLAGAESGRYEIAYMDGNTLRRLYYLGTSYDDIFNSGTSYYDTKSHETNICQVAFNPLYIYHVINFDGKEAISAPGVLAKGETTKLAVPDLICSPLVDKFYFYNADDVLESGGTYTLKAGASPITTLDQVTNGKYDIYVFYRMADINSDIDLTGQTSYNIEFNGGDSKQHFYRYDASVLDLANTADPTDATSADYLWVLKGQDPYKIQFYNIAQGLSTPITMTKAAKDGTNGYVVSNNSSHNNFASNKTDANSFIITKGVDASHYEVLVAYTNGRAYPSQLGSNFYHYLAYFRNCASITNNAAIYHLTTEKCHKLTLTPAGNARHTYIVVNKRGYEALRMTVDGAKGAAPQVPVQLRSPLATNFKCYEYVEPVDGKYSPVTELTNTGSGDITILVTYDADETQTDINLNGEGYYFLKTHNQYDHTDDGKLQIITDGTYDEEKLAYYAWQFDADGDPYDVTLRLVGVSNKALGTPDYINTRRRRAAAKHHILQMYDDFSDNVMTFAILNGANQQNMADATGRYALVVSGHNKVDADDNIADITGNQFNYIGREEDNYPGRLFLLQGDLTLSNNAAQIDNYDDPSQTTIEPVVLHYHYHILAPETGHAIIESYTCTDDDAAAAGMTAAAAFPDALRRLGAPPSMMRFYASATPLTTTEDLTAAYNSAQSGLQLSLDKLHIYARYEVDEDELPFYYSDPSAELDDMDWNLWRLYQNGETYFYAGNEDSGKYPLQESDKNNVPANPQNDDKYLWAFLGDPYRTQIINKKTGKGVYLAVATSKPGNNPQPYEAYIYLSSDETNYRYNSWGYSVHTDRKTTEPQNDNYLGQFFINGVTWTGNAYSTDYVDARYYIDGRGWTRTLALNLSDQQYKIIPLRAQVVYHIINRQQKHSTTFVGPKVAVNSSCNLNTVINDLGYPNAAINDKYFYATASVSSDGIYTLSEAISTPDSYALSIGGKYRHVYMNYDYGAYWENKGADRHGNIFYTISWTDNKTKNYLYVNDEGQVAITSEAPASLFEKAYLWRVETPKVGSNYDSYGMKLYNLSDPTKPVKVNDDYTLSLGTEDEAQTFIYKRYDNNKYNFVAENQDPTYKMPYNQYRTLWIGNNGATDVPATMERQNIDLNSVQLYLNEVKLTYHIYNLQGNKAIGREVSDVDEIAELFDSENLIVPSAIRSPLVQNSNWNFWKDEASATAGSGNVLTTLSLVDASGNIYVTYDYDTSVASALDLTGEMFYNIYHPMFNNNNTNGSYNVFWIYNNEANSFVHYGREANEKLNHAINYWSKATTYDYSYDALDDNALWALVGSDPYAITIENYASGGVSASITDNKVQIHSGETPLKAFIVKSVMEADSEYDEYELILADGTNTLKHFYGSNGWQSDNDDYIFVGSVGNNPIQKYRIRFIPRSVDYYYNIINLNGEKALVYTGKGIEGKEADKLPASIQSPLAENFRFYGPEQVTETTADGVTTYTVNEGESPIDVFPATTDGEGNAILPELYVFYDAKASDEVNLSAGRYYFLKANGKYTHKTGSVAELLNAPVKTRDEVGNYLWMLDANGDPYDMRLRVTGYETLLLDANNLEEGAHNAAFAINSDVEAFCLLPGKSSDSNLYTFVAASGDEITDNRFAYLANGGSLLQMVRGDDYNRETAALQMQLEIPTFNYRYRVVNLADQIAIQYTVQDGQPGSQSGTKPVIPDAIKTPFADYTGYYLEEQYSLGGTSPVDIENTATTYALNAHEPSLDVDGSGGLPYYDADIYVEYEYNGDKTLDVTGQKYYNLKTDADSKYAYNNGGTISTTATAPSPLATDNYMWALDGKVTVSGSEVIDPYQVTLTGYDTNTLTQGFYVVQSGAADGQWVLTKTGTTADPQAATPTDYQHLTSSGSTLNDATNAASTANAQLWIKGIPVEVEYVVIAKSTNQVAIKFKIDAGGYNGAYAEGGDAPQIPELIKSPLAYNFKYYGEADKTVNTSQDRLSTYSFTGKTELQSLGYTPQIVYVTYDFNNANSLLDLGGTVKYNISLGDNYMGASNNTTSTWDPVSKYTLTGTESTDKQALADKTYLWQLTGADPYHVTIKNMKGDNRGPWLHTRNNFFGNGSLWVNQAYPILYGSSEDAFVLLSGNDPADNRYAVVYAYTAGPAAQGAHYIYANYHGQNAEYAYLDFKGSSWTSTDRPDVSGSLGTYRQNSWVTPFTSKTFFSLTFTPNQTQPVKYHLTKQITDIEMTHTDPNVPVRSLMTLPDNWERKYCDYTYTYYYIENGHKEEGEYLNVPITKEEYDAKSTTKTLVTDVEITAASYKSATTSVIPVVYIEVDETTQEPKVGQQLDIYIDYTVRDYGHTDGEGNDDGIPFRRMAKDRTIVNALLTNYAGITDYAFNITSYENLMQEVPVHRYENGELVIDGMVPRKDFLYFMVLNTNDDYSRGNQYFLRREDNGRIAWLDNDYRIHVASSQNLNGWDYSRCAESYRPNDHSVFEEKRSLWAFAGDPYDMYIYNAGAVVEEHFNELTGVTDVTTHRNHVTSWLRLSDSEVAGYTPDHTLADPPVYCWGLMEGKGAKSDETFSIAATHLDGSGEFEPTDAAGQLLYWQMKYSNKDRKNEVLLQPRAANFTGLDYNIKVLPYSPSKFEDVRLIIRRDDKVAEYMTWLETSGEGGTSEKQSLTYYKGLANGAGATTVQKHMSKIDALGTGTVRMFTADKDRLYVRGDKITVSTLPNEVLRAFSQYTLYDDDYFTESATGYEVTYGSVRGDVQRDADDHVIYNEVGMPMYNYFAVNPVTGEPIYVIDHMDGDIPVYETDDKGNKVRQGAPPQTVYIKYEVTSDIFLKKHPTKAEVAQMKANNDHVYFMDFPDPKLLGTQPEAYNTGHHAYFDETATFQEQIGTLHQGEVEKMKWNETTEVFEGDKTQVYNKCRYKTTANRMYSVPEDLKWYFVGDPYAVQVYNTNTDFGEDDNGATAENLARFDPTESRFQFVVDCVHMRTPDLTVLDQREEIEYTDENGVVLGKMDNANYGKPYYAPFYWEVVPSPTGVEGGFALRFRANNQLLGYTNVYYYLAHDGLTRIYNADKKLVGEGQSQKGTYNINLNYRSDNRRHLSGKYRGYHEANDDNTVIRLIQPAKVYFSAYKDAAGDHATFDDEKRQTKEELSEYFGVGETITEVPRHLQRKFVKYCALGYQKNKNKDATWNSASFPVLLDADMMTDFNTKDRKVGAYNMEDCKTTGTTPHTIDGGWVFKETGKHRASYKFRVLYDVDDITNKSETDPAKQVHLFTTDASNPTWLDMMVGDGRWLYYDKTNTDGGSPAVENKTSLVSNYRRALSDGKTGWNSDASGWTDGLKGLHWAFIGDPYDFTILNRRRSEDGTSGTDPMWLTMTKTTIADHAGVQDSVIWTTGLAASTTTTNTSTATADLDNDDPVSHFSLQMWKMGNNLSQTGNSDGNYFLRTASLKDKVPPASETGQEEGLVGDYSNDQTTPGINQTNNYWRLVSSAYKPSAASDYTSYFEMVPYSLNDLDTYSGNKDAKNYSKTMSGLGVKQQLLTIRTAVAKDNDGANNDCFDADVRVYSDTHVKRIDRKKMEIKYGDALEEMPYSLRRYGCEYECWLVTVDDAGLPVDSMQISDFDSDDKLVGITGYTDKTFHDLVKEMDKTKYHLSYVYHVPETTSQYFTTASNALTEDYTWLNTYFAWDQYYSGTNIEVEYYENVFDHYVYSADGHIIDEVWRQERRTKIVSNPTEAYPTNAFLNSHTGQDRIYADEGTQSESDRQKWSLVGDPYEFTMKNYAQYLINPNSVLTRDGTDIEGTNITSDAVNFAITIDKKGKAYLTIIDENGEAITSISFDYSTTSDKRLKTVGTGTNLNDPTGNSLDVSNVKPFNLANLIRYADILQYHLVIAHQHSLDPVEDYLQNLNTVIDGLSVDEAANRQTFKDHLLEFLMYKGIRKNNKDMYVKYTDGSPSAYKTDADATGMEANIKTLLKTDGSLRDFISYPIVDYSVSRVGIGNHPQVPWYMKRQFCRYYIYQRDIMRSVTDTSSPAYEVADDDYIAAGGTYVTEGGINYKTDSNGDKIQRTFVDDGVTKLAYNIKWVSISDKTYWDEWDNATDGDPTGKARAYYDTSTSKWLKKPKYYDEGIALNGKVLDKLQDCHYNRKVLLDVVYEVIPEEFRFATRGRNTTAWYQMMTNNDADGLMNFTYKDGIGARMDRTEHYTNNYLWAPEGDPYGFVLRSRYATINGTGWDNVAVTTKGRLPKEDSTPSELTLIAEDAASSDAARKALYQASYTSQMHFDDKRIIHFRYGQEYNGAPLTTDGATNAIYEMFTGTAGFGSSFLMHPTSAYLDTEDSDFKSYYMVHNTTTDKTELEYKSARELQTNADANWRLSVNAGMLWPYFERAGYVGGLAPAKALQFTNQEYYNQLKTAVEGGAAPDFGTLKDIQNLVFDGTFKDNLGNVVAETADRPAAERLPMTFTSTNLVNMQKGYYRIRAFSQKPLDIDGNDMSKTGIKGITGPRYVSGYRFESEKIDNPTPPHDTDGGRWLHFLETDMAHSDIHTYADLKTKIDAVNTAVSGSTTLSDDEKAALKDRDVFDHTAMHGNIEILPADFDPSSIFYFSEVPTADNESQSYTRYTVGTQGLQLRARAGGTQAVAGTIDADCGHTELVTDDKTLKEGYDYRFRLADIGGTAVTLRTIKTLTDGGHTWDDVVSDNLKTNYVCIDRHHRYRITCHTDNEMVEIGDHSDGKGTYGIQDTKWLLQPVGIHEDWPYNEMPLRVEVHKGGVKNCRLEVEAELKAVYNRDNYYYGSMYVPFDTRLGNTADVAFTLTGAPTVGTTTDPGSVTMASVSQLNEMGNPLFVPAAWPVVIRTANASNSVTLKNQKVGEADPTTYATRHYVNLYLPNATPTTIVGAIDGSDPVIKLKGEYLEQTITTDKHVMVFGLPFKDHNTTQDDTEVTHHEYDEYKQVGFFTNDNWAREGYSGYKAHADSYSATGVSPGTVATDAQRDKKYVYHNKIYYLYTLPSSSPSPAPVRYSVIVFGDEEQEQPEEEFLDDAATPWPCDVYDLQGRKVARDETPATLRHNHPGLPAGIYFFGGRKVVVR